MLLVRTSTEWKISSVRLPELENSWKPVCCLSKLKICLLPFSLKRLTLHIHQEGLSPFLFQGPRDFYFLSTTTAKLQFSSGEESLCPPGVSAATALYEKARGLLSWGEEWGCQLRISEEKLRGRQIPLNCRLEEMISLNVAQKYFAKRRIKPRKILEMTSSTIIKNRKTTQKHPDLSITMM